MKISQNRRKIGYTYSSVSGSFPFRSEKSISFESTLERDLLLLLEYDPRVIDVIEQPVTIEYENANGRNVTYTPDFLVHYRSSCSLEPDSSNTSRLIEVKPQRVLKTKWQALKPKFKVGTSYAKQQGWRFCIYDEVRIRGQYLKNIRFINRYKNYQFDQSEGHRITNHLKLVGHTAIDHLLEFLYVKNDDKGIALAQIWSLIAEKVIACDMTLPLNIGTVIWLNLDAPYGVPADE
jgi:hypothetical protein